MRTFVRLILALSLGVASLSPAFADGGGGGGAATGCRLSVGPFTLLFSAYQPQLTADAKYCTDIPGLGRTNLVVDYEAKEGSTSIGSQRRLDREIKKMKLGVKLIRESDGKVLVDEPPKAFRSGIVETVANLDQPGSYEFEVKLVGPDGKEMENHLELTVGKDSGEQLRNMIIAFVVLFAVFYLAYLSHAGFRQKVDALFGKLKEF